MSKKPQGGRAGRKSGPTKKQLLAAAIASCRDSSGRINPAAVVAAARDPSHRYHNILHAEFEWDKDKLVEQALLSRAAELIRQCRSIVVYEEREVVFPVYVAEPRAPKSTYIETVVIARNKGHKRLVLETEINRIKAAVQRAAALAIVFGLQAKFEKMLHDLTEIELTMDAEE